MNTTTTNNNESLILESCKRSNSATKEGLADAFQPSSPTTREPERRRRRVSNENKISSSEDSDDEASLNSFRESVGDHQPTEAASLKGLETKGDLVLPDPAENISPDEFLVKLVKALYDVELQVKPALSLENFFLEVTEEQMAAYTVQLVSTVRNNDLAALKKHHAEGQRLDCFNRFGESLLNMACRRGFEEIAEYLLDLPGIAVRIRDDCGRTPLHDALWHPSPQQKICKWIMERDPTLFLISDKRGFTPFQYARTEHWHIWRKFLLDNAESLRALIRPENLSRLSKE